MHLTLVGTYHHQSIANSIYLFIHSRTSRIPVVTIQEQTDIILTRVSFSSHMCRRVVFNTYYWNNNSTEPGHDSTPWWDGVTSMDVLAVSYGVLAVVALVQIIRIQARVPEYGWTTQKVFHALNFMVALLRAVAFGCRPEIQHISPVLRALVLDVPGLLFFSTYTLLVLFWAEIYYQALSKPADTLKRSFILCNVVVYGIECGVLMLGYSPWGSSLLIRLAALFMACVSFIAACAFVLYGGRLFLMLQRFPIDSRGRRSKLQEVGLITSICASCFLFRSFMVARSAYNDAFDLDVMGHPVLNILYYGGAEIIPSAMVLYILRKLPPKKQQVLPGRSRRVQGYESIPEDDPDTAAEHDDDDDDTPPPPRQVV
jgi:hypothetical protein